MTSSLKTTDRICSFTAPAFIRLRKLGLVLLLLPALSFGQAVRLSDKNDQFLDEVQKLMATGGPAAVQAGTHLQTLWSENRLSAPQQQRVMALSRRMNQKRLQAAPYFAPFYDALYHAMYTQKPAVQSADMDGLLTVVEKLFDTNDPKLFARTLETIRQFLYQRQLYGGNLNKLYAMGGTFQFRVVDDVQKLAASGATLSPADSARLAKIDADKSRFDGWDDLPSPDSVNKQPRPAGPRYVPQRRPIPTVSGVVITLKNVSLGIVAFGDSAVLSNTSGDLLLKDGVFVGHGGTFTWETAGRPDIFATLTDYSLNTANPRLLADDVTLTYEKAKPIVGTFEYLAQKHSGPAVYPRFLSWQSDILIPNLGSDIDYRGGLALAGAQMVGSSASGQPALLIVKQKGKLVFKASSRRFDFKDSTITAKAAAFVGYIDADSLTHPAVAFRFDKTERVAWLNRIDRSQYARVPYSDSYHKFFIQPEVTRWDVPRQKVDFYQVGAKSEVPVRFESFDYFLPQRYTDLTVDYGFHPMQVVANFISIKKQQTFLDDDLVAFQPRVNATALRGALNRMVLEGYLDRNAQGMLRLSQKGALYILAYVGKRDYDNFQVQSTFNSTDSVKNASINLTDKILTIRGVNGFIISDSLKIFGVPSDKTLRVGKGRSFTLNGQLKAGNLRYAGQSMQFDYDKFAMNLNKIDSITFSSQKLAAQGKNSEIGGDIKYDNPGTVYLGSSENRSGQIKGKKTTQRLVMPQGMTVYFDQPERGNLAYNRKVYFKIPAIDNDTIGKGDISFVGTFHSDGIFPPFKATLETMPDNMLGFVQKVPVAVQPLYGGKSTVKLTSNITMDKSGLRAEGVLNHLTASLNTKGILFMTDSLLASGEKGEIKEGLAGKAYFPAVALNDYSLKWWPKADSMVITTKKNSVSLYAATTNLDGDLVMRSSGLFGNGTLRRKDAEAVSKTIKFNKEGFTADNSSFTILSGKEGTVADAKPVLVGTAVDVDFNQTKGIVGLASTKNGQALADTVQPSMAFPFAAYKASISRAQWNINAKTIAMKASGSTTAKGSPSDAPKTGIFTATAEEQEGLTFAGAAALYDIEKMTLNISGVPFITSADARIYPEKGLVTVKRNGDMVAFKNARLELDTVSLFHKLRNGTIQVLSRTRFAGEASYQYPTMKGDTAIIKMQSFELKEAPAAAGNTLVADTKKSGRGKRGMAAAQPATTYFTVARAEVNELDNLQLAPSILYKGAVTMRAPEKDLALDGYIKPALKKRRNLVGDWLPFKEKVAERLEIKVDKNLKNEGGQPLVAGIHFGANGALYPTFLSPKEDPRDQDLFTATGVMRYDDKAKVYRVTSSAEVASVEKTRGKDKEKNAPELAPVADEDNENAFAFSDAKGLMTYKGKLNMLTTNPPYLLAAGSAKVNIDSALYRFNTLMAFSFPVPEPITTAIASKLITTNQDEGNDEAADDDLNRLADKLVPLIGQAAVDAYRTKAQNAHAPLNVASPKLNAALVLANANLRWSDKYNAFYSIGRLGVSNMMTADINAQMDGLLEIRKGAGGDEVSILLESSPDVWVFYDYKPGNGPSALGQLAIVTSEQDINDQLTAGSKNSGKATLEVVPATAYEKEQFVDRYLDQYKTRAKAAPRPKKQPKPATPTVAATGTTTTPAAATTDPNDETGEEPVASEEATDTATKTPATKTAKTDPKAKGAKLKPGAKPATKVAAKEAPKPEKKDKEAEREGF